MTLTIQREMNPHRHDRILPTPKTITLPIYGYQLIDNTTLEVYFAKDITTIIPLGNFDQWVYSAKILVDDGHIVELP